MGFVVIAWFCENNTPENRINKNDKLIFETIKKYDFLIDF
jgi:hypothetical protein